MMRRISRDGRIGIGSSARVDDARGLALFSSRARAEEGCCATRPRAFQQ